MGIDSPSSAQPAASAGWTPVPSSRERYQPAATRRDRYTRLAMAEARCLAAWTAEPTAVIGRLRTRREDRGCWVRTREPTALGSEAAEAPMPTTTPYLGKFWLEAYYWFAFLKTVYYKCQNFAFFDDVDLFILEDFMQTYLCSVLDSSHSRFDHLPSPEAEATLV